MCVCRAKVCSLSYQLNILVRQSDKNAISRYPYNMKKNYFMCFLKNSRICKNLYLTLLFKNKNIEQTNHIMLMNK